MHSFDSVTLATSRRQKRQVPDTIIIKNIHIQETKNQSVIESSISVVSSLSREKGILLRTRINVPKNFQINPLEVDSRSQQRVNIYRGLLLRGKIGVFRGKPSRRLPMVSEGVRREESETTLLPPRARSWGSLSPRDPVNDRPRRRGA